jgi:DNA repair photolyase
MGVQISQTAVRSILTRTTGFLTTVSSHSLQPYRGCTFGNALCGVGCYVQHNSFLTRGHRWGSFLEVRTNAAESYRERFETERSWARASRGRFGIFMSSSTDPFLPQEDRFRITRQVLETMRELPPDLLILQTHTHRVTACSDLYRLLANRCELRIHISVESDRDRLPGLPPPASSVAKRLAAAAELHRVGLKVVVTVSPLFPIDQPRAFFKRISEVADAVVIDHFIQGDGTPDGRRTFDTALPGAMSRVDNDSVSLNYRDRIVMVAREVMPGRVGIHVDGFAGRLLP